MPIHIILCIIPSALVMYFLVKRQVQTLDTVRNPPCRLILERFSIGAQDRWVLITGCDSGFGRLTALRLVDKGIRVFAGCYTKEGRDSLEQAAAELHCSSCLHTFQLDITSDESVKNAFDFVKKTLDSNDAMLWGLVNNAGAFPLFGPDDWCSVKQYSDSLNVNCLGAVRMCHRFLTLIKQSKGRVVTMGSSAGRMHGQFLAPYCAAKFAVEAYSDCLRFELRRFGVTVHILEPGAFKTELLSEAALNARVDNIWASLSEDVRLEYGEVYKANFKTAWNSGVNFAASSNLNWVVYVLKDFILSVMYKLQPGPPLVPQSLQPQKTLLPK